MKLKPKWPSKRLTELYLLRKLLNEIGCLNDGNHHLERTKRIIKLAERLREFRGQRRSLSFFRFLETLAWEEGIEQ